MLTTGDGAVLPTLETVKDGSYAPLSRPLFIYVNSKAAAKEDVQKFVNFYLDNAGEVSKAVGYIPLKEDEYTGSKNEVF